MKKKSLILIIIITLSLIIFTIGIVLYIQNNNSYFEKCYIAYMQEDMKQINNYCKITKNYEKYSKLYSANITKINTS